MHPKALTFFLLIDEVWSLDSHIWSLPPLEIFSKYIFAAEWYLSSMWKRLLVFLRWRLHTVQNWTDVPWCFVSLSSLSCLLWAPMAASFLSGWTAWLSAVISSRSWFRGVVVLYIASCFPMSSPELVPLTDSPFSEVALEKRHKNWFHVKDALVAPWQLFSFGHLCDPSTQ